MRSLVIDRSSGRPSVAIFEDNEYVCEKVWDGEPIRLLGIRTAKLVVASEPVQLSIFDIEMPKPPDEKHQKLNLAMEEIRAKYGKDAVVKASLMKKGTGRTEKNKKRQ